MKRSAVNGCFPPPHDAEFRLRFPRLRAGLISSYGNKRIQSRIEAFDAVEDHFRQLDRRQLPGTKKLRNFGNRREGQAFI